jgi:hypothetical protein
MLCGDKCQLEERQCLLASSATVSTMFSISQIGNKLQRSQITVHQSTGRDLHRSSGKMVREESKLREQCLRKLLLGTHARKTRAICNANYMLPRLPNVRGRTRGRDRLCPTRNVTPVGRGAGTETEEAYNERNHRICDNQHGKRR